MADAVNVLSGTPQHEAETPVDRKVNHDGRPNPPRRPPLHQIYALPAPIRTFPLPSFYPSNPLSLFQLLYVWAKQVRAPPAAEPSVVHQAFWSRETRSVHVTNPVAIRALWEQGFFGKGNYSRSEPNWLKREFLRKSKQGHVSEDFTRQRREERILMKWDRAKKEQDLIEKIRRDEAWIAPVGPKELLALPNSTLELERSPVNGAPFQGGDENHLVNTPSANGGATVAKPNGVLLSKDDCSEAMKSLEHGSESAPFPIVNGIHPHNSPDAPGTISPESLSRSSTGALKRRKSVRFSPKVESTTFQLEDPPSPNHAALANGKAPHFTTMNGTAFSFQPPTLALTESCIEEVVPEAISDPTTELVDKEHLQLTMEEAFYLVFALGVLCVIDPATGKSYDACELFTLFRQNSHLPPRSTNLQPDDPFLIHYAVYHHFRSLGWAIRPGVKFGVDWMLYNRGPVFNHAEFALVVLPSYTHPTWKSQGRRAPDKTWHWLHLINRVQNTALKTMVLVYVDIPPPCSEAVDAVTILKRYKIREFIVKRWLSNRNR